MNYVGYAIYAVAAVIIIACIIGAIKGAREKNQETMIACVMFSIMIALGVVMLKVVFPSIW